MQRCVKGQFLTDSSQALGTDTTNFIARSELELTPCMHTVARARSKDFESSDLDIWNAAWACRARKPPNNFLVGLDCFQCRPNQQTTWSDCALPIEYHFRSSSEQLHPCRINNRIQTVSSDLSQPTRSFTKCHSCCQQRAKWQRQFHQHVAPFQHPEYHDSQGCQSLVVLVRIQNSNRMREEVFWNIQLVQDMGQKTTVKSVGTESQVLHQKTPQPATWPPVWPKGELDEPSITLWLILPAHLSSSKQTLEWDHTKIPKESNEPLWLCTKPKSRS